MDNLFLYGMDPCLMAISLLCFVLSLAAQGLVKIAFARYSRVANTRNLSGAEAAREMLSAEGVAGVAIRRYNGSWLSDHYDPSSRVINLSPGVYDGRTVAAVGIACHEAGHALQHAQKYAFLGLRTLLVPTAGLGSKLGIPLIFIGMALGSLGLAKAGLVLFGSVFLFQLITLPVELDASSRAKRALLAHGIVGTGREAAGVSSVLNAAALTYVAAAIASLMELLYWAWRLGLLGGRRSNR